MKYALIEGGTVRAISHEENSGWVECEDDVYPGHTYSGGVFTPPAVDLLADKRARAVMVRSDFLVAAVNAGLLPASEAKEAAKGDWPATFAAAFSGMSQAEQDEAEIRWGAATEITRLHPLLLAAAAALDPAVTDAQLDALFGITE